MTSIMSIRKARLSTRSWSVRKARNGQRWSSGGWIATREPRQDWSCSQDAFKSGDRLSRMRLDCNKPPLFVLLIRPSAECSRAAEPHERSGVQWTVHLADAQKATVALRVFGTSAQLIPVPCLALLHPPARPGAAGALRPPGGLPARPGAARCCRCAHGRNSGPKSNKVI